LGCTLAGLLIVTSIRATEEVFDRAVDPVKMVKPFVVEKISW
jgi:hypothetical protein